MRDGPGPAIDIRRATARRLPFTIVALMRVDFYSEVLALSTSMTVILPQRTSSQIGMAGGTTGGDPPVLYLLHGLTDDDTIWVRRTSVERYVAPLGLAVVMPQVGRSFYADEAHGNRYWTFLSEELPELCRSFFRISDRRGHVRGRAVDGRVRGGEVGAAAAGTVRRGGQSLRGAGHHPPAGAPDRPAR